MVLAGAQLKCKEYYKREKSRYRGRTFEFKGHLLKLYEFLSIPSWGILIALNIGAGIGRRAAKGISIFRASHPGSKF
jgi:hypothetical protein